MPNEEEDELRMRIECHAHLIPESLLAEAGPYGPDLSVDSDGIAHLRVGSVRTPITTRDLQEAVKREPGRAQELARQWFKRISDPAIRIAEMDNANVDVTAVSISPLLYLYWAEGDVGTRFARAVNEALAAYCEPYPDRLLFMATLPMQDVDAAAKELHYAVETLHACCITIAGGELAGRELDSPDFDPVYALAQDLDVPLLVHPYPTTFTKGSRHPLGLDYILEFCYQETVAFATLIYGGVLDRFTQLKIGITHGGGFVPYQLGRLEAFAGPEGSRARRKIEDYLDQFFFDLLIHDRSAREFLVRRIGSNRIVVGSNWGGIDSMNGFDLLEELDLAEDDHERIAWRNAARLFKLPVKG